MLGGVGEPKNFAVRAAARRSLADANPNWFHGGAGKAPSAELMEFVDRTLELLPAKAFDDAWATRGAIPRTDGTLSLIWLHLGGDGTRERWYMELRLDQEGEADFSFLDYSVGGMSGADAEHWLPKLDPADADDPEYFGEARVETRAVTPQDAAAYVRRYHPELA